MSNATMDNERAANPLIWAFVGSVAIYLAVAPTLPGSAEITSYRMLCVPTKKSACDFGESIYTTSTFRADMQTNSVTYWFGDSSPSMMRDCSIRDKQNWACVDKFGIGTTMLDGNLSGQAGVPMQTIPKWKWLLYKSFGVWLG